MEDLIFKYLREEASEAEKSLVESWISSSEANMKRFHSLKSIVDASSPAFDRTEIKVEKAYRKVVGQSRRFRLSAVEMFRRVAAVLFIPLVGLSVFLAVKSVLAGKEQERILQKITLPYGAVSEFALSDGSKVWLGSGSTLEYPLSFGRGCRTVSLEGEAVFCVLADENHPFVVNTGGMTVKAVGTEFSVNSYEGDPFAIVALRKGIVSVNLSEGREEDIILSPDNVLTVDKETSDFRVSETGTDKWFCWTSGRTVFSYDSLAMVLSRLRQLYNAEFHLQDKALGEFSYRASFEKDSLDDILEVIQMSIPVKFIRTDTFDGEHSGRCYEVVSALK